MITPERTTRPLQNLGVGCFGPCHPAFSARECPTLRGVGTSLAASDELPIRAHIRPARACGPATAIIRLDDPRRSAGKKSEFSLATRRIAVRRPEISARLQAIRLRQRQCAQRRRRARQDRRTRSHLHVRWAGQPRPAAGPGAAHHLAEGVVGRDRQGWQETRPRLHHAGAAARLGPLPHQGVHARPQHRLRAREGLLGPIRQRQHRPR